MQVEINGEQQTLPEALTLNQLIAQMELTDKRIAVELNLEIIPRSEYPDVILKAGDRLEIVHAIGGG